MKLPESSGNSTHPACLKGAGFTELFGSSDINNVVNEIILLCQDVVIVRASSGTQSETKASLMSLVTPALFLLRHGTPNDTEPLQTKCKLSAFPAVISQNACC